MAIVSTRYDDNTVNFGFSFNTKKTNTLLAVTWQSLVDGAKQRTRPVPLILLAILTLLDIEWEQIGQSHGLPGPGLCEHNVLWFVRPHGLHTAFAARRRECEMSGETLSHRAACYECTQKDDREAKRIQECSASCASFLRVGLQGACANVFQRTHGYLQHFVSIDRDGRVRAPHTGVDIHKGQFPQRRG